MRLEHRAWSLALVGSFLIILVLSYIAVQGRTKAAHNQGNWVEGWRLLEKSRTELARNPDSAFWHNQASVAYGMLGDLDAAKREIELAIKIDPRNPIHYYAASAYDKQMGRLQNELENLNKALDLDPHNPTGHFAMGDALERSGGAAAAIAQYKLCLDNIGRAVNSSGGLVYYDSSGSAYSADDLAQKVTQRIAKLRGQL